jgi:hypothetical protein
MHHAYPRRRFIPSPIAGALLPILHTMFEVVSTSPYGRKVGWDSTDAGMRSHELSGRV